MASQRWRRLTRSVVVGGTTAALVATMGAASGSWAVPGASVPVPEVIGPIAAPGVPGQDPTRNYPQQAAAPQYDLASRGYVEREYFFSGEARRYQIPEAAASDALELSSGHDYTSRMIARYPADESDFNGTVIVEWNSTHGYDHTWRASKDFLTDQGYAYVGVSASRAGVHTAPYGLKAWSPDRYSALDLTANGTINDDSLSWDVFSQGAQAVRSGLVLDTLEPTTLLATGLSAAAGLIRRYHNSIQPLSSAFDGFLPTMGNGGVPYRTDLSTKVLDVETENSVYKAADFGTLGDVTRPDLDNVYTWWVAGGGHMDYDATIQGNEVRARDGLSLVDLPQCTLPSFTRVDLKAPINAAIVALEKWVQQDVTPARSPRIEYTSLTPAVELPRDDDGLVYGGIRYASVEVPTATNTGWNAGPSNCSYLGTHEPFSAEKLAELYPLRENYVREVKRVSDQAYRDGFLTDFDRHRMIAEAEQSGPGADTSSIPVVRAYIDLAVRDGSLSGNALSQVTKHIDQAEKLIAGTASKNAVKAQLDNAAKKSGLPADSNLVAAIRALSNSL